MSQTFWELSSAIGRIALGIVCLVIVLIVIRQIPSVRKTLIDVLPRPIASFLQDNERTPPPTENKMEGIRSRIPESVFQEPKSGKAAPAHSFGMGSTKRDVSAIQGSPTRRTDNTWFYGTSEVYFAGDRVVGWRNSTANPLRVQ